MASIEKILSTINKNVTVVGVTKHQPIEKIRKAILSGMTHLGVNYAQDGEKLLKEFQGEKIQWHFIGHIQSRKTKFLPHYDLVQSLDRLEVAQLLNKELQKLNRKINCLVELNIGEEPQKSGVYPHNLENFLTQLKAQSCLKVVGLMGMPPLCDDKQQIKKYFKKLREQYDLYRDQYSFKTLSMGTSEDYQIAIDEGSNMVRLGTILFGPRN